MSGLGSPSGSTPPPAGDPSMEDILASIRRILNEDEPGQPPGEAAARPAEPEPEALVLTEDMLVGVPAEAPPPQPVDVPIAAVEPPPPVVVALPIAEPPPTPVPAAVPVPVPVGLPVGLPVALSMPDPEALLAPAVAAAATASVSGLLRAVAQEKNSSIYRGGPTIEDVVRDEVRVLLKEWLDANLPALVERLVRVEIERVVGRAVGES